MEKKLMKGKKIVDASKNRLYSDFEVQPIFKKKKK